MTVLNLELPAYLEANLLSGLKDRLRAFSNRYQQDASDPPEASDRPPSLFAMFRDQGARINRDALPSGVFSRWLLLSTSIGAETIPAQLRVLDNLSDSNDRAVNLTYALGAAFAHDLPKLDDLAELPPEDLSLIVESVMRLSRTDPVSNGFALELGVAMSRLIQASVRSTERADGGTEDHWAEPLERLGLLDGRAAARSLSDIRHALMRGKMCRIQVFGPDLFSAFQATLDPNVDLSKSQLEVGWQTAKDWGVSRLYLHLLLFRLVGPYETEREFLRTLPSKDLAAALEPEVHKSLEALLKGQTSALTKNPASGNIFRECLRIFSSISSSTSRFDGRGLVDSLIDLYCLDERLPLYLDWNTIYNVLASYPTVNARTTFVTLIMNHDDLRFRYPYVAMATGKGALIGDLTSLLGPRRRSNSVNILLSKFNSLPPPAARALCLALLDRPTIERLAVALPRLGSPVRDIPAAAPEQVSLLRVQTAQAALENGLISKDLEHRIVSAEVKQLRMAYFQTHMRFGRVQIDWSAIERIIADVLHDYLPRVRSADVSANNSTDLELFIRPFTDVVVQKLAREILYESPDSVDQALSNNLRHGVVVPRFLRAFDDAFQTVIPGRRLLPAWDEATMSLRFGLAGLHLIKLREAANSTLKDFVAYYLTIEPGGDFDRSFRQTLMHTILRSLEPKRSSSDGKLEERVGAVTRRHTKALLNQAAKYLDEEVGKRLEAAVRAARASVAPASPSNSTEGQKVRHFLDCLETNFHEAGKEVRQWLQVAERRHELIPFRFSELVKLHLLSMFLSASDRLNVKIFCHRKRNGQMRLDEFSIAGKYMGPLQEIVHNLISNAFKHSGQNLRTEVRIDLIANDDTLVFKCRNSVSDERIEKLISEHPKIVDLCRRTRKAQARKDQLSGFQKIRHACVNGLKRNPSFNVPPISVRQRAFTIEITLKQIPGLIVESEIVPA